MCVHVSEQVCYHMGSETEPDERDKQTDRGDIDILMRYVTRCLPGLVPVPAVVESCMYTVSHFIVSSLGAVTDLPLCVPDQTFFLI